MVFNRRIMLQASVGAIALSLSGCSSNRTSIIFANGTALVINAIDAFAGGMEYADKKVAPDKYSVRGDFPTTSKLSGVKLPLTGTFTLGGVVHSFAAIAPALTVTAGRTNTFTVHSATSVTSTVSNS